MSRCKPNANNAGCEVGDCLAGYEYQMDVSVWLALDLLVANKLANKLVLEPASQEDLEASLEESEPGRATERLQVDNYVLVVQVKLRTGDAWTVAGIKALLAYGSDRRLSATKRLADPKVRYLLVTSAALNGKSRGLGVRNAGVWPKPSEMARSISKALPCGAAGRVAVIGGQDQERLTTDIKRLLVDGFRVPNSRWKDCLKALREEARVRIRGTANGIWRREDLEQVIRHHEGYLASSPELDDYVKPTNWPDLLDAMQGKHAALIIGQSGTGKTLATQVLYEELRKEIPGLARVRVLGGPSQVQNDQTPSPVLFDIEDPWGRFDFERENRSWNDQLDKLLARATHDRMIVATTRRDVADSAGVLKSMRPWIVPLEAEHYGDAQRVRLFQNRIPALPWELRLPVGRAQSTVLRELATPLEIQKFFDAVATLDRPQRYNNESLISESIRIAHENCIERNVVEQIKHRNDVRAAAVIWALLKIEERFFLPRLLELEEELASNEATMDRGVLPFVRFFVAARNLRQKEEIVSYYQPRVEAGIEKALEDNRLTAAKALQLLIETWVSMDGGHESGAYKAATLLASIPRKSLIRVRLKPETAKIVDTWLEALLAQSDRKFEEGLRLAAAAGSKMSGPSEIARYLLHREDRQDQITLDHWWKQEQDEAWYSVRSSEPATAPLIERFVREVLPFTHGRYWKNFAHDVKRLVPGITEAFLDAAHKIVDLGVTNSDDAIAEGALEDLTGFEAVVDEAFRSLNLPATERAEQDALDLAILNGEYSEEYVEHLVDGNENGYTAGEFIKAYIRRVRATVGWQRLVSSPHCEGLRPYWLRELLDEVKKRNRKFDKEDSEPTAKTLPQDEIEGVFRCAYGTEDEDDLWYLMNLVWDDRYLAPLLERLKNGNPLRKIRVAALTVLTEHKPARMEVTWEALSSAGKTFRQVEIALDLAHLYLGKSGDWEDHKVAASTAMSSLPQPFRELSEAFLDILNSRLPTVSEPVRLLIEAIDEKSEDERRLHLAVGRPENPHWLLDLHWLLDGSEDPEVVAEAVRGAERADLMDVLNESLSHRFAAVRAEALRAIGSRLQEPLPTALLRMAADKGKSVRMALTALLEAKIDPAHMPTLIVLVRDKYSTGSHYENDNAELPIARAAVAAIKKYGILTREHTEDLKATAISADDRTLRAELFEVMAIGGGAFGQELLFDLAAKPGRHSIRRQAANGLLHILTAVAPEITAQITVDLLASQIDCVSAVFSIVLGAAGEASIVKAVAVRLAADLKRRALVLLLIRLSHDRGLELASELAELLPAAHPALKWALGGEIDWKNDQPLSDLGDPGICREVFQFMKL